MRKELARNFVNGFVAQRSIDEPDFSAAEILFKETCQLAGGAGIVRAVEVNVWIGLQFFKAARPDRVGDSLRNVVGGNAETTGGQLTRGGQRVQGILQLEAAGQAGGNFEGFPRRKFGDLRARETVPRRILGDLKCLCGFNHRTFHLIGASEDDFARLGCLRRNDRRHARLEDSSFLTGDFFQRVAEEIFVVEINAGNDRYGGRKNVRGIEASAEANFENAGFDAFAREIFECHGREAFEIRRMRAELMGSEQLLDQSLQAREYRGEGFVANFLAVDAHALVDAFQMR